MENHNEKDAAASNEPKGVVVSMTAPIIAKIEEAKKALTQAIADDDTKKITTVSVEIRKLEAARKRLAMMEVETEEEDEAEDTSSEDFEKLKQHVRASVLTQADYYYVHDMGKFVLYREASNEWIPVDERGLKNHFPLLIPNSEYFQAFMEVLREDGRWFYGRTSSFTPSTDKLNMLRPQIIDPVPGNAHPIFDLVIRSIAGDKPDNIEHIEKVLVAKHAKPDNYLLPVLCFSDDGSTGKSLFAAKVISTLFGKSSVSPNVNMKDFAGQFNGHLAGKLFVFVNENCEESYNHNRMKAIAGSPTITYTNKNQMPYEGDNTALLMVSGNSIGGAIRVGGGDVDRRFSVMCGTRALHTYVADWLTQTTGQKVSGDDAKNWIVTTGQNILSDPDEVGKWLYSLQQKHPNTTHVLAHHGADYKAIVEIQAPLWEQCFEVFFADPAFTYVKRNIVYDFYREEARSQGNRISLGKKKFYQHLDKWLLKNQPHIQASFVNWNGSTANVYVNGKHHNLNNRLNLTPNDGYYCYDDGYKVVWKVAI